MYIELRLSLLFIFRTVGGGAPVGFQVGGFHHLPATPRRTPYVPGLNAGCHEVFARGDPDVASFAETVVAVLPDLKLRVIYCNTTKLYNIMLHHNTV